MKEKSGGMLCISVSPGVIFYATCMHECNIKCVCA